MRHHPVVVMSLLNGGMLGVTRGGHVTVGTVEWWDVGRHPVVVMSLLNGGMLDVTQWWSCHCWHC